MIKWYRHQQDILNKNPKRWAFVWSMGTGKSLPALQLSLQNAQSTLIICPKGLKEQWEAIVEDYEPCKDKKILVITKETFRRDYLAIGKYDCVLCDECHYFLGTKSAMMKSLRKYMTIHDIQYRYFLTGTPYRSTPMDIYMLATLLGHKLDYWKFFYRFFNQVSMGRRIVPVVKKGIEKDIAEVVSTLGNTVKLEECIDMPPQTFKTEYFTMTPEQKKAIAEMDATMAITRYTTEHQICGGCVPGDEYKAPYTIPSNKLSRLLEVTEELDRVIVVCRYNNEIEHIVSELKKQNSTKTIEYINGSVNNRKEILDRLTNTDKYVLVVNAKISEGWQLSNCSHMVFYSYDFELKNKLQMEARITRIDKPRPTFYLSLVTTKTVDEAIVKSLDNKESFHVEIYARQNSGM